MRVIFEITDILSYLPEFLRCIKDYAGEIEVKNLK